MCPLSKNILSLYLISSDKRRIQNKYIQMSHDGMAITLWSPYYYTYLRDLAHLNMYVFVYICMFIL